MIIRNINKATCLSKTSRPCIKAFVSLPLWNESDRWRAWLSPITGRSQHWEGEWECGPPSSCSLQKIAHSSAAAIVHGRCCFWNPAKGLDGTAVKMGNREEVWPHNPKAHPGAWGSTPGCEISVLPHIPPAMLQTQRCPPEILLQEPKLSVWRMTWPAHRSGVLFLLSRHFYVPLACT